MANRTLLTIGTDDRYHVFNLFDDLGRYIDSVGVSEEQAMDDNHALFLAKRAGRNFGGIGRIDPLGVYDSVAIDRLLDKKPPFGDYLPILYPQDLEREQNRITTEDVMWDGLELLSHGGSISNLHHDMLRYDHKGELVAKTSLNDILGEMWDDIEPMEDMAFDAIVESYNRLDLIKERIFGAMTKNNIDDFRAVNVTLSKPFKRQGAANVAMTFDLSDGQTITVFFRNPDADPKKLGASDVMISWKWLLNKRDVTGVLQPENGKNIKPDVLANLMMNLAHKNQKRFASSQKLAERHAQEKAEKEQLLSERTAYRDELEQKIERLTKEIEQKTQNMTATADGGESVADDEPIVLTGDEFGEFDLADGDDVDRLRDVAIAYLYTMRDDRIDVPALKGKEKDTKVQLRQRGFEHIKTYSSNPEKLLLLKSVRKLLSSSKYLYTWHNAKKDKKRNIELYHYLVNDFNYQDKSYKCVIVIEKDDKGLLHYDVLMDKYAQKHLNKVKEMLGYRVPENESGGEPSIDGNSTQFDSTNQALFDKAGNKIANMVLNLFIFDENGNEIDDVDSQDNQADTTDTTPKLSKYNYYPMAKALDINDEKFDSTPTGAEYTVWGVMKGEEKWGVAILVELLNRQRMTTREQAEQVADVMRNAYEADKVEVREFIKNPQAFAQMKNAFGSGGIKSNTTAYKQDKTKFAYELGDIVVNGLDKGIIVGRVITHDKEPTLTYAIITGGEQGHYVAQEHDLTKLDGSSVADAKADIGKNLGNIVGVKKNLNKVKNLLQTKNPVDSEFLSPDDVMSILQIERRKSTKDDKPTIFVKDGYYYYQSGNWTYRASQQGNQWVVSRSDDGQLYSPQGRFNSIDELIETFSKFADLPQMVADDEAKKPKYDKSLFKVSFTDRNGEHDEFGDDGFMDIARKDNGLGFMWFNEKVNPFADWHIPEDIEQMADEYDTDIEHELNEALKKKIKTSRFTTTQEKLDVFSEFLSHEAMQIIDNMEGLSMHNKNYQAFKDEQGITPTTQASHAHDFDQELEKIFIRIAKYDTDERERYKNDDVFYADDWQDISPIFHGKTLAFAKAIRTVNTIAKDFGYQVRYGDFNHTADKGLFDNMGITGDYGICVQLLKDDNMARCQIGEKGTIKVLVGASGLNSPHKTAFNYKEHAQLVKAINNAFELDSQNKQDEPNLDNGKHTQQGKMMFGGQDMTKIIQSLSQVEDKYFAEYDGNVSGKEQFKMAVEAIKAGANEVPLSGFLTTLYRTVNAIEQNNLEMLGALNFVFDTHDSPLLLQALKQYFNLSAKTNKAIKAQIFEMMRVSDDELLAVREQIKNANMSKTNEHNARLQDKADDRLAKEEVKYADVAEAFKGKTPMEIGQAKKQLVDKVINTPLFGETTYKTFIEKLIDDGYKPVFTPNQGGDGYSNITKDTWGLEKDDFYTLNKTQYGYAVWYYEQTQGEQMSQDDNSTFDLSDILTGGVSHSVVSEKSQEQKDIDYLNDVIGGKIDVLADEFMDKFMDIMERLDETYPDLIKQAVDYCTQKTDEYAQALYTGVRSE